MQTNIISLLRTRRDAILESWITFQLADAGLREDLMSNQDLREQSEELLDSILNTITDKNFDESDTSNLDAVNEILAGISYTRAKQGFTPRETGVYVFSLKDALIKTLKDEYSGKPDVLVDAMYKMDKVMDSLGITTFETFIKGREDVILRQTDEIAEISTPVIRLWHGILALPIIGTLDSARTQVVMENLLQEIVESGSTVAILDISGVPAVDSLVAQHLIKTVSATRLMGAECIISGIRPEIAQTVVHLGIDLSNIVTKSTLASALQYAFGMLRLEVKKIQNK